MIVQVIHRPKNSSSVILHPNEKTTEAFSLQGLSERVIFDLEISGRK